jgi:hypothetical protein
MCLPWCRRPALPVLLRLRNPPLLRKPLHPPVPPAK